jgi:small-conductance mechanosensitive channel
VWDDILAESLRGILTAGAVIASGFWLVRWWELPASVTAVADKVLLIGAITVGFVWLLRFSVAALRYLLRSSDGALPAVSIVVNVVRLAVVLAGLLVILQLLGIPITPLITALGIGGLAIALALQDTLANLFSGLHILAAHQVRPGDFVQLDSGHEGFVEDINWRTTTIRTLAGNMVIIPNSKLANAIVVNYQVPEPDVAVIVPVSVAYGSNLEVVEQLTAAVARTVQREVPVAVPDFEPLVRFREFGDSGVRFNVILKAQKAEDQFVLRHEFIKRLYAAYQEAGIVIPFPMRELTGKVHVHIASER